MRVFLKQRPICTYHNQPHCCDSVALHNNLLFVRILDRFFIFFVVALSFSCIETDIDAQSQVSTVGTNLSTLIDLFPDLPTTLHVYSFIDVPVFHCKQRRTSMLEQ